MSRRPNAGVAEDELVARRVAHAAWLAGLLADPSSVAALTVAAYADLVDDLVRDVAVEAHREARTGLLRLPSPSLQQQQHPQQQQQQEQQVAPTPEPAAAPPPPPAMVMANGACGAGADGGGGGKGCSGSPPGGCVSGGGDSGGAPTGAAAAVGPGTEAAAAAAAAGGTTPPLPHQPQAQQQQHPLPPRPAPLPPAPGVRGPADVFGNSHPGTAADLVACAHCGRRLAAGKFAYHLEKCLAGRQARGASGRAAARRAGS